MTQPITATSLIKKEPMITQVSLFLGKWNSSGHFDEKEPMSTQVGQFLDKWNSSGHFDQTDNRYLTYHYFRN